MWTTQTTYSWIHPSPQENFSNNQKSSKTSVNNGEYILRVQTTCPADFEQITFDAYNNEKYEKRKDHYALGHCQMKNDSFVAIVDLNLTKTCDTKWIVRLQPVLPEDSSVPEGPCVTADHDFLTSCDSKRVPILPPETCPVFNEQAAFILQSILLPVFITLLMCIVLYLLFAYIIYRCPRTGTRMIRVLDWVDDQPTGNLMIPCGQYNNVTSQSPTPIGSSSSSSNVQFLNLRSNPHHSQHSNKSISDETVSQSLLTQETSPNSLTPNDQMAICIVEIEALWRDDLKHPDKYESL